MPQFLNTPYQVNESNNPYSLALYVCKKCGEGEVAIPDGPIAAKPAEVGAAVCDARVLDVEREAEGRPLGNGWPLLGPGEREPYEDGELERRLTTVVDLSERAPVHAMVRTAPRALRKFLLHRDRGCCAVPGCRRRLWLEAHHIVFFRNGGPTEKGNLVLVCPTHHRLIHEGKLRVRGVAPHGLMWTTADGTPLRAAPSGVAGPTWDGAGTVRDRRAWSAPAQPFGKSGSARRRSPVASWSALASAGASATIGVSPAPAEGRSLRSRSTVSSGGTSRKRGTR